MKQIALACLATLVCAGCAQIDEREDAAMMIDQQVRNDLQVLQTRRVYFGHQSVGADIIQGVHDILTQCPDIRWEIRTLDDSSDVQSACLVESLIGRNEFPELKCRDFTQAVEEKLSGNLDIALMKFCFADIMRDTEVNKLFAIYREAIAELKRRDPKVTIVHVTVPLTEGTSGLRRFVNNIIGRVGNNDMANIRRHEFNTLLMNAYNGEPVFDLEAAESTRPDGSRESFRHDGNTYYAIAPSYSSDAGGHLNEAGRRVVAKAFLHALANAARAEKRPGVVASD